MSTTMSGYVEVLSYASEPGDDDEMWLSVICTSPVASQDYEFFCRLFGVRCAIVQERLATEQEIVPIAPGRGLPKNPSPEAFAGLKGTKWISWATAEEVGRAFALTPLDDTDWGWHYLRDSVRLLASKLGPERVRLVVGFR
jgi:hypothetical protein